MRSEISGQGAGILLQYRGARPRGSRTDKPVPAKLTTPLLWSARSPSARRGIASPQGVPLPAVPRAADSDGLGCEFILKSYSSSISLSGACSGERHAVMRSDEANTASRSMAAR